jgi:DNA gyrase subunit A
MLLEARLARGDSQVVLATKSGYAIRFEETRVRAMGRTSTGVRGVSLQDDDDQVVGMIVLHDEQLDDIDGPEVEQLTGGSVQSGLPKSILVLSENGMGKRSNPEEYRITNRGGKGVRTMQITQKTGDLVSIKAVTEADDLMVTTRNGIVIRLPVNEMRIMGRATQGVRVIKLQAQDSIADVAVVPHNGSEDEEE